MELHWLPIKLRIELNIVLSVFKIYMGFAPSYLISLMTRKPESRYDLRIPGIRPYSVILFLSLRQRLVTGHLCLRHLSYGIIY